MMETQGIKFEQMDQVRLLTTRNVTYLSAPPGTKVSPHGIWQVVGAVNDELLLVKNETVIRIPTSDVLKEEESELKQLLNNLGRLVGDGKGTEGKVIDTEDLGGATKGD